MNNWFSHNLGTILFVLVVVSYCLVWLTDQNRICISMLCTRRGCTRYLHLNTFPYLCYVQKFTQNESSAAHLLILLLFHIVWLAEIEPTYMQMHQEWIHQWHINIVVIFYLNCTGSAEQILTEQHQFLLFCFILFGYQ
jgi:hypothetical protein